MWFFESSRCFSLYSIGFCIRPNGIFVLIRSKLSMKSQCIDQVVLKKAKSSCNR